MSTSPRVHSRIRRIARHAVAPTAVIAILVSCGADEDKGTRDAPIDTRLQDNSAPYVVNMPDSFMNIAIKCIGPNGIYAHTRPAAPVVVPDDPLCVNGTSGIGEVSGG